VLAADILTRHHANGEPDRRYLMRAVGTEVRGVMSDKFRRLDALPLADSFLRAANSVGAVPTQAILSAVRVAMRAVIPTIFEIVPGEFVVFGLSWGNSDFGRGSNQVAGFIERVACLNGMVTANVMAQVHLGRRLETDIALSDRTYRLDTAAAQSALTDVVAGLLTPAAIRERVETMRETYATETNWQNIAKRLGSRMSKAEREAGANIFDGADAVNVPEGKTVARAAQTLAFLAQSATPDRRLDLERLAGELTTGEKDREVSEE
jgi:hypothetical protein